MCVQDRDILIRVPERFMAGNRRSRLTFYYTLFYFSFDRNPISSSNSSCPRIRSTTRVRLTECRKLTAGRYLFRPPFNTLPLTANPSLGTPETLETRILTFLTVNS